MSVAERLQDSAALRGVPLGALQACVDLWEPRELATDQRLWLHGESADALAFIDEGGLRVEIAGEELGELELGQIVGETAALSNGYRTASVVAARPTRLLVIRGEGLAHLRLQHAPVYDQLLVHALKTTAQRVHAVGKEIAKLAHGAEVAPKYIEESALRALWKRFTGVGQQQAPSALPVLRRMRGLREAETAQLSAILAAFEPHFVERGHPVFLEAEVGTSVFLLADGCVDVLRNVGGQRAERLASLYEGALFGTGSLLLGQRRNASCVAAATTDVWVYELTQEAHRNLRGEAGRLWREALLAALWFQLARADERLVELRRGGKLERTDYEELAGSLLGLQAR